MLLEPQYGHEFARNVLVEVESGDGSHQKVELEPRSDFQRKRSFLHEEMFA